MDDKLLQEIDEMQAQILRYGRHGTVPMLTAEHMSEIIQQARDRLGWIPVSERLPENNKEVLMLTDNGVVQGHWEDQIPDELDVMGCDAGFHDVTGWSIPGRSFGNPDYFNDGYNRPTHWMPLPPPPDREE